MSYLKKPEVQVPVFFTIISIIWIVWSDVFFLSVQKNITALEITHLQSIKGCVFVIGVAVLIHYMIKASNKRLIKSQEEYKDLFQNTPNPMLIYDLHSKQFQHVNKAAIEIYGYSLDEFRNLSIHHIRAGSVPTEALLHDGAYTIYRHKKKNSETLICHETKRAISFHDKLSCLLSAHDITELQFARNELVQREKQLKQILDSITDGFFMVNEQFVVLKSNELFNSLVQRPDDEVEGKTLDELFPGIKETSMFQQYQQAMILRATTHFESRSDATNKWYNISAYPFEDGLCVFFRDITREKQDELQRLQQEQNLLALINNTDDLIWSIDANYRYFTYNEPFYAYYTKVFGEDLWLGKSALNTNQGSQHVARWKSLYERALRGEKYSIDMDFIVDSIAKSTTIRFNPIYGPGKQVIGVGCFLQNITDTRHYERRIEQQNQQLKQIAFITSHKVRAPLANILGLAEVLDREDPLSTQNTDIIENIKASAKQLDQTIIDMVNQTLHLQE